MRYIIPSIITILVCCLFFFIFERCSEIRSEIIERRKDNPFTRIGSITTKNGVAGEIFKVNHTPCYVLVQVSMPEMGRNYMQLECR